MESQEIMNKYEMVIIIDARMTGEEKETTRKEVSDIIAKEGGEVINSRVWLEKQKFTFRIKKCPEGSYFLFHFQAPPASIIKLRGHFKLNEKILRSLILNEESVVDTEVASSLSKSN